MAKQHLFMYVVARDFGFAPNPFHGVCTLATCKPVLRKSANVGDWVVGMGGSRLKATGQCVFAMRVGRKITFSDYWGDPLFRDKIPVRNGSSCMMVGDNIYHRQDAGSDWIQENSHHSLADGSTNHDNLKNDTQTDAVLVSDLFYYFGASAPIVPEEILGRLGYRNGRSHRKYEISGSDNPLIEWIKSEYTGCENQVLGDPFDFEDSDARYSVATDKVT